jgi:co-chaperonin GroES (HSP10)
MIEPLCDNLIVEPMKGTRDGIFLPDRSVSSDWLGTIRFVGPDVMRLAVGDVVILPTWNDDELKVDGKKYIVLAEKNISVRISG